MLGEDGVLALEDQLVGLRSDHHGHVLVEEAEAEAVAQCVVASADEVERPARLEVEAALQGWSEEVKTGGALGGEERKKRKYMVGREIRMRTRTRYHEVRTSKDRATIELNMSRLGCHRKLIDNELYLRMGCAAEALTGSR